MGIDWKLYHEVNDLTKRTLTKGEEALLAPEEIEAINADLDAAREMLRAVASVMQKVRMQYMTDNAPNRR